MQDAPPEIPELAITPYDAVSYRDAQQAFIMMGHAGDLVAMERIAEPLIQLVGQTGFGATGNAVYLVGEGLLAEAGDWMNLLFQLPLRGSLDHYEIDGGHRGYHYPGREQYRKGQPDGLKQFFHYGLDTPDFFSHTDEELETLDLAERRFFREFGQRQLPLVHTKMRDVGVLTADAIFRHYYGLTGEDGKTGFLASDIGNLASEATSKLLEYLRDERMVSGEFAAGEHRDISLATNLYAGWDPAPQPCLEVKTRDIADGGSHWVVARAPKGSTIFNIGFTWEEFAKQLRQEGRIPDSSSLPYGDLERTYHRVRNRGVLRRSYPLFFGPRADYQIGRFTVMELLERDFAGFIGPVSSELSAEDIEGIRQMRTWRDKAPVETI